MTTPEQRQPVPGLTQALINDAETQGALTLVDESTEALRLRREIQQASHGWNAAGQAAEDLLSGGRLARSRVLIENGDLPVAALDREFVEASYRAERALSGARELQRQEELRFNRIVTAVVSALSLVAIIGGIVSTFQRNVAITAEKEARLQTGMGSFASHHQASSGPTSPPTRRTAASSP